VEDLTFEKLQAYRPISLLSIPSKVLEQVVFNRFIKPPLSNLQFGFLPHRSTICQLLLWYSETVEAFEANLTAGILYLNLKKTFDSVPHQELLYKQENSDSWATLEVVSCLPNRESAPVMCTTMRVLHQPFQSSLVSPVHLDHYCYSSISMILQQTSFTPLHAYLLITQNSSRF